MNVVSGERVHGGTLMGRDVCTDTLVDVGPLTLAVQPSLVTLIPLGFLSLDHCAQTGEPPMSTIVL
jgi:hypothetical protein